MQTWKLVLLAGTATLALGACTGHAGPGEIGSRDDIVVRNAGDDRAPPPPELAREEAVEEVTEVAVAETVEDADAGAVPEVAEVIAAPEENIPRAPDPVELAQEEAVEVIEEETEVVTNDPALAETVKEEILEQAAPEAVLTQPMETTPMTEPETMRPAQSKEPTPMPEPMPEPQPVAETPAPQPVPMAQAPTATDLAREVALLREASPETVMETQQLMQRAGFYTGPVDGKVTGQLLNDYVRFRTSPNVAVAPAPTPAPAASAEPMPVAEPVQTGDGATATIPASDGQGAQQVSVPTLQAPAGATTQTAPATPQAFTAGTMSMSDPAVIAAVQKALIQAGFYSGAASGKLDTMTLNALSRYQSANKLTPGGLNMETLRSLGVVSQ